MNKQEIKTALETNLETLWKTHSLVQDTYKNQKELKEAQDLANKNLKDAKQEWTLKLSEMDKDQLKEYGSNEAIREAKFKLENADLVENLEKVAPMMQKMQESISEGLGLISALKHEKDILICLAGIAE
jgi:hypothetical protein